MKEETTAEHELAALQRGLERHRARYPDLMRAWEQSKKERADVDT